MLQDSSEQVKKELARIVGQLSCIQSDLSKLTNTHTEASRPSEMLCCHLSLAAEHTGNVVPSLRASVVKPFLPLLTQQTPSTVKLGM